MKICEFGILPIGNFKIPLIRMKVAFLVTVLALLIGTLLLSMWMRTPSYEGFETAPDCTYSAEIPGYLDFCANDITKPFVCPSFDSLDAAKIACSTNEYCRGITRIRLGNTGERSVYTIRVGAAGSTDYTNLETMKKDMIRPPPLGPDGIALEYSILVTNLLQCKAGKPAAKNVNPTAAVVSGSSSSIRLFSGNPSGGAPPASGGVMGEAAPEFMMSGESVTVPGNTLIAVPAGQTLFARRTGAGSAAGAPTESRPAPPIAAGIAGALRAGAGGPGGTGTFVPQLTQAQFEALNLSAEEREAIAGLPNNLVLKIVDATRRGISLRDILTAEELATLRAARQTQATGAEPSALLTTPSFSLSSQTTGTLTTADLQAIQQAAAAGAASVVNA